jgi:quercetin dioxygenase-like cupin family protein
MALLAAAGWALLGATWFFGDRPALAGGALLKTDLAGIEDYDLRVWRNAFPAGSATDFHHHAGHEVVYVLDGRMTVRIEEREVPLETGELVYVPAGTAMQLSNRSDAGGEILIFMLAKKGEPLKQSHP